MATTRRLTCTCKTCKTNASKIGATFPLQADFTPKTPESATALAATKQGVHRLVAMAHHPSSVIRRGATNVGVVAVR